jgi:hypothetical protein
MKRGNSWEEIENKRLGKQETADPLFNFYKMGTMLRKEVLIQNPTLHIIPLTFHVSWK